MKTFNEWLREYTKEHGTPPAHVMAEAAWDCQQAEIDRLMLEFCPDEMEVAQFNTWAEHQQAYTGDSDRTKEQL